MLDSQIPPTLKRPRSSSIPPSPTGSSSSKKAASEDLVSSPAVQSDQAGRIEVSPLSNSIIVDQPMTQHVEVPVNEEGGEGSEWVKMTEDVHLDEQTQVEQGVDSGLGKVSGEAGLGGTRDESDQAGLGKAKYEELYNALLSESPPPFKLYERYYLLPCKFRDDLKAAAFTESSPVKLDMTPLLASSQGEDVYIIGQAPAPGGSSYLYDEAEKETMWKLKDGQVEDEDFFFITENGWNTLATAVGAQDGPSLSRFCISGAKIQLSPPIYTLYQLQPPSTDSAPTSSEPPIRFSCPTDTSISVFIRIVRFLFKSSTPDESLLYRIWQFDSALAAENNDAAAKAALQSSIVQSPLVPALASKLVASSGEIDSTENISCSDRNFESGDSFILELGKPLRGGQTDWALDVSAKGEAVVKPTINMPPVPTAPAPLFSQPAKFPGSTPSTQAEGSGGMFGMTTRAQTKKVVKTKGLVGLVNLGNTCFMNSATQCLSNTVELCDYFLSGVYQEELNRDNPLGMSGQVAEAFGGVVENLWSPSPSSSFSPRQLKQTTSRFAPQFAGYGQHDTQEFIAFLLDGLHEDLNRIHKKPYVEKPDWKAGGGNKELAELGKECWGGYKKRNDSVIVDLFQGQLMSTLVCPECHKESITMDPFMYLTVPLPIAQHREFKFHFIPRNPEQLSVKGRLLIPANASFMQIKEKLGKLMNCNPQHILGYDHWKNSVYAWWIDSDHNMEAKDTDEAVFVDLGVPNSSTRRSTGTLPTDGSITVPVFTYALVDGYRGGKDIPADGLLMPFWITLSKAEAGDAGSVREAIAKGYARFMSEEAYTKLWVPSNSTSAAVPQPQETEEEETTKVAEIPVNSEGSTSESRPGSPLLDVRSSIVHNTSSTSLSTLGSAKSGRIVPRGDLYKVHVTDSSTSETTLGFFKTKEKDNTVPLYKGGDIRKAAGSWSLLESRRKVKKNLLGRFTSGLSSIVGSSKETSEEEIEEVEPVVRAGEAIFVEWEREVYNDYMDGSRQPIDFLDPSIEKERAKKKEGKSISIEDCLDEFSKEETLGQEDLWFCPICIKHQAATKKLEIYKAPDILVICIKRFGSSRRLSDKLDNLVNFPIEGLELEEKIGERRIAKELKLSKEEARGYGMDGEIEESWVYDLYAVDNHFGGLGGGHYTAFCKNKEDGDWYNYDDSRVSKASQDSIQSRAAYLLFYRRRTIRPIGGLSRVKAEEALSRNPSRAVSPTPPSPTLAPLPLFPSTSSLRNPFPPTSSSPADSLLSSSSPMTSDDEGRLPAYSPRLTPSPPHSTGGVPGMDIDSDEDDLYRGSGVGLPYGGTDWGINPSQNGPVRHSFANSGEGGGMLPSPPDSIDGHMDDLRRQTAARFRPDEEDEDRVSEVDSLEVEMGRGRLSAEEKAKERESEVVMDIHVDKVEGEDTFSQK